MPSVPLVLSVRKEASIGLRLGCVLAAALWWLCVAVTILLALAWGVLHAVIVPRIGDLRPTLENRLTQTMGVPVKIGAISAQFKLLAPAFELLDVRLQDSLGRDALVLQKITATVSPRSLLSLGFEQLVVEQPQLDVRRNAQGQIFVAGFPLPQTSANNHASSPVADWIFSQHELAIHSGSIRWTDELRGLAPLALDQVDVVVRNSRRAHQWRVDGTPPPQWGKRFSVVGDFRSQFFGPAGQWKDWQGQAYADFAQVDVSQLQRYVDLPVGLARGTGAARVWAQLAQGKIVEATADVALTNVDVKLGPDVQPLVMPVLSGRLAGQEVAGGLRVSTQNLAFRTQEGTVWPGGNVSFLQTGQGTTTLAYGELKADRLDLAALAQVADRLPIGTVTQAQIRSLAPQGTLEVVQAAWQGHISAPTSYSAQGRVKNLGLEARNASPSFVLTTDTAVLKPILGRPGVRGADVDFKLTQTGGQASIAITKGTVELPGVFEDPIVPFDSLTTSAQWSLRGEQIDVKLDTLKFANADAQGEAKVHWQTADSAKSRSKSRFPGVLDLQGSLLRGEGTQVHRYLPQRLSQPLRNYVRDAIQKGRISSGKFNVKGDLFDMPFADPKLGEFRIAVKVAGADFAYVPPSVQPANTLPWPPLLQVNGELVFDRVSMAVNGATGRMGNSLLITKADASIPNLASTTVVVNAEARGPLADMLAVVNGSPLLQITSQSLAKAAVTGNADIKLQLNLPISNMTRAKVAGTVTLAGNDVQMTPETPLLARAIGAVGFSETGFTVKDAQATLLGGEIKLEGGTRSGAAPGEPSIAFRGQGVASAEALRQATALGFVSRLGLYASGSAAYTATLAFRAGVPELSVASNLQGMALNFPVPLTKAADAPLALRYDNTLVPASMAAGQTLQDQILVDIGGIVNVAYVRDITGRDTGKEPRVLRGGIGVGLSQGETATPPDAGVLANINLAKVDLDAWQKVLNSVASSSSSSSSAPSTTGAAAPTATEVVSAGAAAADGYVPSTMAVRARALTVDGRTLNNVVVGGSREGLTWRANIDASELNGYGEYRQASSTNAGRVYARLARLNLAPAAVTEIEAALESKPTAIPALDIVVEDFELRGKKFGRIEIEATNRDRDRGAQGLPGEGAVREWRLNKFNATMPEAQFSATGNWAASGTTGAGALATAGSARPSGEQRRTAMNFKLDIANSGELLQRIGMDKVIAKGKGSMQGQVAWTGSPLALDYPSMSGSINVNIETGQFLKVDPGFAKLLGVLSLQSLPRRLSLDFRDVFTEGFAFDFIRGDLKIDQGVAFTNNLQMKGVNAAVLMEGTANLAKETQDLRVVVVPEIDAGTASLVAAVINPVVGLGTFLAQLILRRPLIEAATQEFQITGPWVDPKITKVPRKSAANSTPPQTTETNTVTP